MTEFYVAIALPHAKRCNMHSAIPAILLIPVYDRNFTDAVGKDEFISLTETEFKQIGVRSSP